MMYGGGEIEGAAAGGLLLAEEIFAQVLTAASVPTSCFLYLTFSAMSLLDIDTRFGPISLGVSGRVPMKALTGILGPCFLLLLQVAGGGIMIILSGVIGAFVVGSIANVDDLEATYQASNPEK